jgi:hypothetical protein
MKAIKRRSFTKLRLIFADGHPKVELLDNVMSRYTQTVHTGFNFKDDEDACNSCSL